METNCNQNPDGNNPHNHMKHFGQRASVLGVFVVIAGLLLLARNTGFIDNSITRIIFSWEMLLIVLGVFNLLWRRSITAGLILIALGTFFLLVNFYHMPFSTWQLFLPAVIIIVGLQMIFGTALCKKKDWHSPVFNSEISNEDYFEDVAIFGGGERKIVSQAFKGGKLVAVFGGSKLDLSRANIVSSDTPFIEVVAIFGGTSLIVPADWNVRIEVFNIFGGFSDKRTTSLVNQEKTILVKGVTIFGGGDIKSY